MAAKPVITADELASIGEIDYASLSSQAFLENYDNITSGNITVAQSVGGLTTASFVSQYINQVEEEFFTAEEALAVFVADDFAAIKRIAGADEATQQAFVELVTFLNGHFHGLSATLAETSPEANTIFEARGFDFTQYPTLEAPDLFAIENPSLAEELYNRYHDLVEDDPEYLFNHVVQMQQGYAIEGANLDHFRQMLAHDNFKLLQELADRNDDDIDELVISIFEILEDEYPGITDQFRERAPELGSKFVSGGISLGPPNNDPTPDPHPEIVITESEPEPEPEPDTAPEPEPEPAGEPDPAPAAEAEPEAEEEPAPPPPPPPGASILEGLIRPQITPRAVMSVRDAKTALTEIEERLNNLPADLEQRQRELLDIGEDLKELAVAIRPEAAGDPRLLRTPPLPSDAANYDDQFGRLHNYVLGAIAHDDVSNVVERLIQSSEAARMTARAVENDMAAERRAEAEARVRAEADAEAAHDAEPDAAPAIVPDAGGSELSEPDVASVVEPDAAPEPEPAPDAGEGSPSWVHGDAEHRTPAPELAEPEDEPEAGADWDRDGDGVPDWVHGDGTHIDPPEPEADPDVEPAPDGGADWDANGDGVPDWVTEGRGGPAEEVVPDAAPDAEPEPEAGADWDADEDGVPDWVTEGRAHPPVEGAEPEAEPEPTPADILRENAESMTVTRLSELLDGHGYHNDVDNFTDYDAMQGAFNRAAELGITSQNVVAIRDVLSSPDFILKTSAAIDALTAYNAEMTGSGNEQNALAAFFDTLKPEDFVQDRSGVKDDNSVYDRAERDAVRQETLHVERTIIPKL